MQYVDKNKYNAFNWSFKGFNTDYVVFLNLKTINNEFLSELNDLTDEYDCGFVIEDPVEIYKNLTDTYYDVPVIGIYSEELNYEFTEKLFDLCRKYDESVSRLNEEFCYKK